MKVGTLALINSQPNATELRLSSLMNTADAAFEEYEPGTSPPASRLCRMVMISYRAKNSERVAGRRGSDRLHLLLTRYKIDESNLFFARVEPAGGLAPEGLLANCVAAPRPALKDGDYRVLVQVDSRALNGDAERADNLGVLAQGVQVAIPALTLGVPHSNSIRPGRSRTTECSRRREVP